MSGFPRIELITDLSPSLFLTETSIFVPKTLPLTFSPFVEDPLDDDLICSPPLLTVPAPFEIFESAAGLIQIHQAPPFSSRRTLLEHRLGRLRSAADSAHIRALTDRVSSLERRFDRLVNTAGRDMKHTWKAEIKGPATVGFDRKYSLTEEIKGKKNEFEGYAQNQKSYKWTTEIKGGKGQSSQKKVVEVDEEGGLLKNYKWTVDIKDKEEGEEEPIRRTYSYKASAVGAGADSGSGKKEKKKEKKEEKKDKKEPKEDKKNGVRLVEIEEPSDHGAVVLRQAFARRRGADLKCKGKKKELSPQDAALMIQITFKAYLIRRSQALRALRSLAVAKAKLKEIRALFHNFSYRNRIAQDQEERQRFSEKIIVLLLTVDAVEGADIMVRSSKRSMVDELEVMLDVVDPQPPGKSLSMKRRTFDMPNGAIQNDIAAGVTKLVQIIDQDGNGSTAFEACL